MNTKLNLHKKMSVSQTNVVYESKENPQKLLQYANEQRQEELYNDVTIKAGSQVMRANCMILSCYSKVFEKMFRSQMKEQYQDAIEIKDFDGEAIKLLIDFIYKREISIDQDNVMKLLKASHFLQLDEVTEFCFSFLEGGLMVDHCLDILSAYMLYKPESSLDNVYRFIVESIEKIVEIDRFKSLSKDELVVIIPNLNNAEQASIYKAIRIWVEHDSEHRSKNFPCLFNLIDLDSLTLDCLEKVAADELVKKNYDCINAVVSLLLKKLKQPPMSQAGSKILCLGGNGDYGRKVIEVFNVDGISTTVYPELPVKMSNHCVLHLNNTVYSIGGSNSLTNVYRLNLNSPTLKWKKMCSMNEKRKGHGAAVFQNSIVVTGNYGLAYHLGSAEFHEIDSNEWKTSSSMIRGRSGHGLVECNGYLYAIGGSPINEEPTVERLRSLNGEWEPAPSMLTSRDCVAAVNCGGCIYAIGGVDGNSQKLKTVEKFDPVVNKWCNVKAMNYARLGHAACVLRGKIYVVGGWNAEDSVKVVECYDPANDSWSVVGNVTHDVNYHALVAV